MMKFTLAVAALGLATLQGCKDAATSTTDDLKTYKKKYDDAKRADGAEGEVTEAEIKKVTDVDEALWPVMYGDYAGVKKFQTDFQAKYANCEVVETVMTCYKKDDTEKKNALTKDNNDDVKEAVELKAASADLQKSRNAAFVSVGKEPVPTIEDTMNAWMDKTYDTPEKKTQEVQDTVAGVIAFFKVDAPTTAV